MMAASDWKQRLRMITRPLTPPDKARTSYWETMKFKDHLVPQTPENKSILVSITLNCIFVCSWMLLVWLFYNCLYDFLRALVLVPKMRFPALGIARCFVLNRLVV